MIQQTIFILVVNLIFWIKNYNQIQNEKLADWLSSIKPQNKNHHQNYQYCLYLSSTQNIIFLDPTLQSTILSLSYQIHKRLRGMIEENMFTVLERGDRKIDAIKKKIIALVGLTRSGKSCTFNWMLGKDMIGQENVIEDNYINNSNDLTAAQLGNEYSSVTLIPNSADLDSETSLVDMAGYCDSRNYIGVMGVSYFLKSIFKHADEVKFLIVFNEYVFFDETLEGMISNLQGFFNMFKIDKLTADIKVKVLSSISFVVTRSQYPQMHADYLNSIYQRLKNPMFINQNKQLMTEVIEQIITSKRIYPFKAASSNQHPQKCEILNQFKHKNWQFLNIQEIQKELNQSFINIPFEKDYAILSRQQKQDLQKAIDQRTHSYSDFGDILNSLINSLKVNWTEQINSLTSVNLPNNLMQRIFCFDNVFQSLQKFIEKNDKYHSEDLIQQVNDTSYPHPTLLQAIRQVLNIYNFASLISDQESTFQQNMSQYSKLYNQMSDCLMPFCKNAQQKKMILRLKFILTRGFRQFNNIFGIIQCATHRINQEIKDNCRRSILSQDGSAYISNFINIKSDLISYFFSNISELEEYEQLFNQHKINSLEYKTNIKTVFEFNTRSIEISLIKANLYSKQNNQVQVGKILIEVIRCLCMQKIQKKQSYRRQQAQINNIQVQAYLNARYLIKLNIIERLTSLLISLDCQRYPLAKDLAIQLCKHFNEIENVCEIYESQLLDYPSNNVKRRAIYQNYADYCIKWGRYPEAKVLLHKKLKLEKQNFKERANTIKAIYNLVQISSRMLIDELKNIKQLQGRPPESNADLQELLIQIQKEINNICQKPKLSYEKQQPAEREEKELLRVYSRMYLQEENYSHKGLIDNIQHLKLNVSLPDYEDFFNSTRTAIKDSLKEQIFKLQKYDNSLKSLSKYSKRQGQKLTKQQFTQTFGKSYLSIFYRTAQEKRKTDKQLLFMHLNYKDKIQVDEYETKFSQGVKQLQQMTQLLEHNLIKIWRQRYL